MGHNLPGLCADLLRSPLRKGEIVEVHSCQAQPILAFAQSWMTLFTICRWLVKEICDSYEGSGGGSDGNCRGPGFLARPSPAANQPNVFEIIFNLADCWWLLSEISEITSSHKVLWVCDFLSHKARSFDICEMVSLSLGNILQSQAETSESLGTIPLSPSAHVLPRGLASLIHGSVCPARAAAVSSAACRTGKASVLTQVSGFPSPLGPACHPLTPISHRQPCVCYFPWQFCHSSPSLVSLVSKTPTLPSNGISRSSPCRRTCGLFPGHDPCLPSLSSLFIQLHTSTWIALQPSVISAHDNPICASRLTLSTFSFLKLFFFFFNFLSGIGSLSPPFFSHAVML